MIIGDFFTARRFKSTACVPTVPSAPSVQCLSYALYLGDLNQIVRRYIFDTRGAPIIRANKVADRTDGTDSDTDSDTDTEDETDSDTDTEDETDSDTDTEDIEIRKEIRKTLTDLNSRKF